MTYSREIIGAALRKALGVGVTQQAIANAIGAKRQNIHQFADRGVMGAERLERLEAWLISNAFLDRDGRRPASHEAEAVAATAEAILAGVRAGQSYTHYEVACIGQASLDLGEAEGILLALPLVCSSCHDVMSDASLRFCPQCKTATIYATHTAEDTTDE